MVFPRGDACAAVRHWVAGIVIGGSALASTGCSLLPTTDDVRTATLTVKDTVTGKARKDKLNKTYAEARILERRKDFVQAERLYRELLVAEPKSRDCYHRLGVMAAVQQKYAEAHQNYQAALSCSNPTPDLLSDIGYCHYLEQQLPQAEQALRSALTLDPQHAAATNNLALVVGEQGRLDEAYDLFRKANGEAEAECNFAYLCAQTGDLPAAQAHFSRALSVNPDMRPAAEALLRVTESMQRREDEVRAQLTQIVQQANQGQQPGTAPNAALVAHGTAVANANVQRSPAQGGFGQPAVASQSLSPPSAAPASPIIQAGYSQPAVATSGVVHAGGYAQGVFAQAGGVQLASGNIDPVVASRAAQALATVPQQRLIEVYRGGPRALPTTNSGNSAAQPLTTLAEAAQTSSQAPTSAAQPPAASLVAPANQSGRTLAATPGFGMQPAFSSNSAPAPFSFPTSPSPQYLQPTAQPRMPTGDGMGAGMSPQDNSAAAPTPSIVGRENGRLLPPAARPSALSFPQR